MTTQKPATTPRSLMNIGSLMLLSFLVSVSPASADGILPKGWHLDFQSNNNAIEADFTGSGRVAKAELVTDGNRSTLLIFSDDLKGLSVSALYETVHDPKSLSLKIIPPGEYKTACGKGHFDCPQGDAGFVKLKRPALSFEDENVQIVFVFEDGEFKKRWRSD